MNTIMNNLMKYMRLTMLSSVAAVVVLIGFTACADDTFVSENKKSVPTDGYQFIIPASMGSSQTRAIAYNSETGGYDATFETSDRIYVYNNTKGWNSNNALYPEVAGKTANLIGRIAFYRYEYNPYQEIVMTPEVGDELTLCYKTDAMEYSRDFSYEGMPEVDYAIATVKITAINDGVITTEAAKFINPQSIYKIKFTGLGTGVKIKNVMIHSEKSKLVENYFPNSMYNVLDFGDVKYTYKDEGSDSHELTFMLKFNDNPNLSSEENMEDVIRFRLLGSDGHYYVGSKSAPTGGFEDSKFYQAEIAVQDLGIAMTLTDNATGNTVENNGMVIIKSKDAAYTLSNNGYDTELEWWGGENSLTLKNLSVNNSNSGLKVATDYNDPDNTKEHYLILDGENNITCENNSFGLAVFDNCSLNITAANKNSKLILGGNASLSIQNNSVLTIQSGELFVAAGIWRSDNSRIIITESGKLGVYNNYDNSLIKAASGYVLNVVRDGDYSEYTVTPADPYEEPKALSEATTTDIGKIIGSDGKIHVPNWDLPDGVTPVAIITHISNTGHGLATALSVIEKKIESEMGYYTESYFSWDATSETNGGKTAQQMLDDWAAVNRVSFGTWRFPTREELQTMILNCRIDGDATEVNTYNMTSNGFRATIITLGMNFSEYFECWTSTQNDNGMYYLGMGKNENNDFIAGFYWGDSSQFRSRIFPILEF